MNTISAYEEFMKKHPRSSLMHEAKLRLEKLNASKNLDLAKTVNTIEAYEDFLSKYGESEFTEEARDRVEERA